MKEFISPFDYAHVILNAVKKGVLLTTTDGETVNTMSISWGTMGVQWRKPVFITFVRGCRHTKQMLDHAGEFTVNIPLDSIDPQIISMIPYIVTIIVLILFVGKSHVPAASGKPYVKSK